MTNTPNAQNTRTYYDADELQRAALREELRTLRENAKYAPTNRPTTIIVGS